MYSTKGHEVKENISEYLPYGIHEAKISDVIYYKSPKETEGFIIIHEGKPLDTMDGRGQKAETTWWMSFNAWPYTKERLCIMAEELGLREALDNIKEDSVENYVIQLNKLFHNKGGRWKFRGVEVEGKVSDITGERKNNWFKTELAPFGFVESLSVPKEKSKLIFNEEKDVERLSVPDKEIDTESTADETAADTAWS